MPRPRKVYSGKALKGLIENLTRQIRASEAPRQVRDRACELLQSISGEWRATHPKFPAPPGRPAFSWHERPGNSRTKITVPPDRRAKYDGQIQVPCYWPGEGYEAYARYLAEIDDRVAEVQGRVGPPKEPLSTALDLSTVEVNANLIDSLKGRTEADIDALAQIIFRSPHMAEKTPNRLRNLKSHWKKVLGFLIEQNRLRIDQITDTVLENFRAWCVQQLASGHHKRVYLNDFLSVFRDILGRLRGKFQMTCLPASYEEDLRDITEREADRIGKNAGHPKGNVSFGTTETIAYPPEFIGSLLRLAEPSPLDHLIDAIGLDPAGQVIVAPRLVVERDHPVDGLSYLVEPLRLILTEPDVNPVLGYVLLLRGLWAGCGPLVRVVHEHLPVPQLRMRWIDHGWLSRAAPGAGQCHGQDRNARDHAIRAFR